MLTIFIVLSAFVAALFQIDITLATTQNDEIGDSNQTRDEIIEELQKIQNICQSRVLIDAQQLSEHQCSYFNSCLNSGGSSIDCYNAAQNINCDIENGKRFCPPHDCYRP